MRLGRVGAAALRELARRRPQAVVADGNTAEEEAAVLRAWMYPKQAAFFSLSKAKSRATSKTRRSGATAGGVRELLSRALERPGFRATYVTTTRQEAHDRAWKNDTKSGLIDVLKQRGEPVKHPTLDAYRIGGMVVEVREGDLVLNFGNGSHIELFGADNIRRHRVKRGNSKHVFWIDEAQDFPYIEEFYDAVVIGCLTDYDGECWFTGTPGKDCAGMFYEITKNEDEDDARLPNWEVHTIASVDNPYFGRVVTDTTGPVTYYIEDNTGERTGPYDTEEEAEAAAVTVRWDRTAGAAKLKKGWKGDEPDFVREWLGKWVKTDARYVYPVHAVPKHVLLYAPQRLADNPFVGTHERFASHPPWYDHHAAVADLPRPRRGHGHSYQWLFGLWVDFGYNPDPLAIVIGAFTPSLPDVYEMHSWKCTRVHTDDQALYLKLAWDAIPGIVSFVGDPAGKQDDFEVWRTRMNLPIGEANKKGKNTLEEFLADDVRRGRFHLRDGSPLHTEMKHLVYLPGKPGKTREVHKHRKVNGVEHGDHCCDAARYGYADLTHYLAQLPKDKPVPGTREAYAAEAELEERRIETAEDREVQAMLDREEELREFGTGAYEWQ
jgi:hypothetical protein